MSGDVMKTISKSGYQTLKCYVMTFTKADLEITTIFQSPTGQKDFADQKEVQKRSDHIRPGS